jgi:hypothetical protein
MCKDELLGWLSALDVDTVTISDRNKDGAMA